MRVASPHANKASSAPSGARHSARIAAVSFFSSLVPRSIDKRRRRFLPICSSLLPRCRPRVTVSVYLSNPQPRMKSRSYPERKEKSNPTRKSIKIGPKSDGDGCTRFLTSLPQQPNFSTAPSSPNPTSRSPTNHRGPTRLGNRLPGHKR